MRTTITPGLKKALFAADRPARLPSSGHALLSQLDAGSPGLGAVLAALGSSPAVLRPAVLRTETFDVLLGQAESSPAHSPEGAGR